MGPFSKKMTYWWRRFALKIKASLHFLYKKLKLEECLYFYYFLIHRYHVQQYMASNAKHNFRVLIRLKPWEWIDADRQGQLRLLRTKREKRLFSLKNALFFGAYQTRVERTVFFSFLTMSLELNNPFDQDHLKTFLRKKIALLEGLLEKIKVINGRRWNQRNIVNHIDAYHRNSLLQAEVIANIHKAIGRQKYAEVIEEGKRGIKKGLYPILVTEGMSGTYWIRGANREILGLFKPFDEEIAAPHNPVSPNYQGALGLRKTRWGCRVGEAAHHEVGAYLVDEFLEFGIVPKTYYASFTHETFFLPKENPYKRRKVKTKYGSFQEFISGFVSLENLTKEEANSIPLDEFQLLVVLDVILGNTDRNVGNLLFGEEGQLAAIDHGLCFPDCIDSLTYWYWSYFDQGKKHLYAPIVDLLKNFPFEQLALKLKKRCFISIESIDRMRERLALFTEGVLAGLAPAQLEGLMTPKYLLPLVGYRSTLRERAANQLLLYLENFLET